MAIKKYVDHGWPVLENDLPVMTELTTQYAGAQSPFGDLSFPLDLEFINYIHPKTKIGFQA